MDENARLSLDDYLSSYRNPETGKYEIAFATGVFSVLRDYLLSSTLEEVVVSNLEENTPDLISFKYYGTMSYWWFVCLVNGINDPFTELVPGTRLLMPLASDISQFAETLNISPNSGFNSGTIISL